MTVCKICNTADEHRLYKVREMQFGTREEFLYVECSHCGCLQLKDIPATISAFYPKDYYSFRPLDTPEFSIRQAARKLALRKILEFKLAYLSPLRRWLEKKYGRGFVPYWLAKRGLKVSSKSRILDIGSGSGETLLKLEHFGFRNLLGIDPFIPADIIYSNGVRILKLPLEAIDGSFDFIMMHHSFEHMKEPLSVLRRIHSLLKPRHFALLRIPICSYAWENYRVNWAQIDAPRHLFLHTIKSIKLLAEQAGFEVSEVCFDSNEFQFWASEQYARDIPLTAHNSYGVDPSASVFTSEEIDAFESRSKALNKARRGDQACIYLRRN